MHLFSKNKKGFTLIELMIVILIMGITLGLVSLIGSPNAKTQLKKDAQYLGELLSLIHYESQLQNQNMYVDLSTNAIEFKHTDMPSSTQQFLQNYKWKVSSIKCIAGCITSNDKMQTKIELTPEPIQENIEIIFSKDDIKLTFKRLGDGTYTSEFSD
jgi:general secretion pathway protein H